MCKIFLNNNFSFLLELNVDIRIKEWTWSKKANKPVPEYVKAEALRWGVPTIQRLWFG